MTIKKLLILLLFCRLSVGQEVVSYNNLVERDGIIYRFVEYQNTVETKNLVPYTGRVYVMSQKIDLSIYGLSDDDIPNEYKDLVRIDTFLDPGIRTNERYYIDRYISREFYVKDGLLEGLITEWNQWGIKTKEVTRMNEKFIGSYKTWDDYGKIIEEGNYNSNGDKIGKWVKWKTDNSGQRDGDRIQYRGSFDQNGLMEGLWENSSNNGGIFKQYYEKGKKVKRPKN